jgi:hypothetical protein
LFAPLLACTQPEPDVLDPEVIKEAAEAQGDAEGSDYSGTYVVATDASGVCDCPTVAGMDLCNNELTSLAAVGGVIELVQTDGTLILSEDAELLTLSGALNADGSFDLGGVYGFSGVVGEISVYIHLIGGFSSEQRFTGALHSRAVGEYQGDDIDCRTEVELDGTRFSEQ